MNFSFCLPSRGEEKAVFKMLDSFERTTRFKDKIEFLIAIDEGKTAIVEAVERRNYGFRVEFFERPQTEDFTNDYYNWLADRTSGDNLIAFNDDTWMRTNHWDAKILRTLKQYGCKVYMLDLMDTARMKYQHIFPCFPCVSRRAFCSLGWLLHKAIPIYPADKVTHSVYHGAHRIIPIRDVLIEHEHVKETDASKKRMMDLFLNNPNIKRDIYGIPQIDVGNDILQLSLVAQSDGPLRLNKLTKIWNIIKEK